MSKYLFIESRDPFESPDVNQLFQLILDLSDQGKDVALFLLQNGVLATRKNANASVFAKLLNKKNITVYADDYSLDERGITKDSISEGIQWSNIDILVDLTLENNRKPMWH